MTTTQTTSSQELQPYDNYEISPCHRFEEPDKPGIFYYEVCEPHEAHVWTLYGHLPEGGVEAIGDFATREVAEQVFQRITGIPFTGSYQAQDHLRVMRAGHALLSALGDLLEQLRGLGIPDWHGAEGLSLTQADAAVAEAAGTLPAEVPPGSLAARQLASAYIQYVKERNPALHAEADGTPSIEAAVRTAVAGRPA